MEIEPESNQAEEAVDEQAVPEDNKNQAAIEPTNDQADLELPNEQPVIETTSDHAEQEEENAESIETPEPVTPNVIIPQETDPRMEVVITVVPADSPTQMDIEPDEEQSPCSPEKPDDPMEQMEVEEECIDKGGDSVTPGTPRKGT